jgi:hypothetical protein
LLTVIPKKAVTLGGLVMDDLRCEQFFREPRQPQHRHFEALRAFFLDRRPLPDIARQFGFAHGTLRNLVCEFRARCQADQPPFLFLLHADDPAVPVAATLHVRRSQPSLIAAPWR